MTDNEIIKELQCASEWFTQHGSNTNTAIIGICGRAVDLINRQKAEIDSLNNRERILIYHIAVERERAIKDFAERLTHTLVINNEENTEFFDFSYTLETIDNLAKEIIGEENESVQQEDC